MPLCATVEPLLTVWGCVAGRNRVLFIRVIKNKCPSPTSAWTAGYRAKYPLHGPRGSGGRETATLEDKTTSAFGHLDVYISLLIPI